MIVLVLVIVWIAVLAPMAVRYFRDGGSKDSIESFHQQLHLLERAGPKLVAPAHTLAWSNNESGDDGVREMGSPAGLYLLGASGSSSWVEAQARVHRRRQGQRRRRDLVLVATATAVVTGGLGVLGGLHLLWIVTAVSVMLIVGCALLGAYAQMLDADRRAGVPNGAVHAAAPPPPAWSSGPVTAARPGRARVVAQADWAARAGLPGAWDEGVEGDFIAGRVAVGG